LGLRVAQVIAAAPGVGIEVHERRGLRLQVLDQHRQDDVLDHVRVVAGVERVAIVHVALLPLWQKFVSAASYASHVPAHAPALGFRSALENSMEETQWSGDAALPQYLRLCLCSSGRRPLARRSRRTGSGAERGQERAAPKIGRG
jgi:hypothetical protein